MVISLVWLCRSYNLFLRKEYAYPQITPFVDEESMRKLAAVSRLIFNSTVLGHSFLNTPQTQQEKLWVRQVMLAVIACLDPACFLDVSPLHHHVTDYACHMRHSLREKQLTSRFLRLAISLFVQHLYQHSNKLYKVLFPPFFGTEEYSSHTSPIHQVFLTNKTYASSQMSVFQPLLLTPQILSCSNIH